MFRIERFKSNCSVVLCGNVVIEHLLLQVDIHRLVELLIYCHFRHWLRGARKILLRRCMEIICGSCCGSFNDLKTLEIYFLPSVLRYRTYARNDRCWNRGPVVKKLLIQSSLQLL